MNSEQWEYKVVVTGRGDEGKLFGREGQTWVNVTMLQSGLTTLGRDGWECIAMPTPSVMVLKRRVR